MGIQSSPGPSSAAIRMQITIDPNSVASPEGYQLVVNEAGVTIIGHDEAGIFYAVQTLRQMLRRDAGKVTLPFCKIEDAPAFPLRGFMHDTGRNFQTVESLKKQIDLFAAYKLNTFHWHLTDNPAWRPQSHLFPQLNDPKFRTAGRDPDLSYSFDQIRDLIRHAKVRHVTVIPELDMPGHSEYFPKAFGFGMGTPKGMEVLEKLIDEFCAEISKDDCPYLHLGADEVHIPNPDEFIRRMTARVRANGRIPILWKPGLKPADNETLVQIWGDEAYAGDVTKITNPIIDSGGGYLNSIDPQFLPQRYFFWQAGRVPKADAMHPGGILCLWPDVRVDDKANIFRHSPVWPTLLAFSESIWQGRRQSSTDLMNRTPRRGSEAWRYLREFEARMADHRERFFSSEPFPWIKQATIEWQVCGPFPQDKEKPWDQPFAPEQAPLQASYPIAGGQLNWRPATGTNHSVPRNAKLALPVTYYLRTQFHCDEDRVAHFMVGFESLTRANRRSGGIPAQGKWDGNGGSVWINGKELTPPVWKNPGQWRFEKATWGQPANEIPITDEEQYWCREPIRVELKKGDNLVLMRIPFTYAQQSIQGICAPVKKVGDRWIEDESMGNTPVR
jgi:hexosaminidase